MSGDEPLITEMMVGCMVVFGADIVLFAGLLAAGGVLPVSAFLAVLVAVVAVYALWIGARWWRLRDREDERDPVETLKERYAAGELSEAEFERRLDRLVEDPTDDGREETDREREDAALER